MLIPVNNKNDIIEDTQWQGRGQGEAFLIQDIAASFRSRLVLALITPRQFKAI